MDMTGEHRIAAPRARVWEALNDPEILKRCIPGCEAVEKSSDTAFSARVMAKVGPVKARFSGEVSLSDLDPPNGYTISGEGKGGAAGFARGGAEVRLAEAGEGATVLSYNVNAQVGGKLAQIGSRLIDSTAKKMAGDFFRTFGEIVEAGPAAADDDAAAPDPHSPTQHGDRAMAGDKHVEENVYPNTHWSVWAACAFALVVLAVFVANL